MRATLFSAAFGLSLSLTFSLGPAMLSAQPSVEIDAETPEGQLLAKAGMEEDSGKKIAILEELVRDHSSSPAAIHGYTQLHALYLATEQHAKAMVAAGKVLTNDPAQLPMAHETLKAAETTKDRDQVIHWAALTAGMARKAMEAPEPQEAGEAEIWAKRQEYAKGIADYADYSLYALALQAPEPESKLALIEALEKQNPASSYLPQLTGQLFLAYQQSGDSAAALALAEKTIEADQASEDMLLLVANNYMESKKEPGKVIAYSGKVVEVLQSKPKPEGIDDADWERKKNISLGLAHWMRGMTHAGQNRHAQADKDLRTALPLLGDNDQLKAAALFQLGVANFKMGDAGKGNTKLILEAVRFTEQCAAIKSPYQARARTNLANMKKLYSIR